MSTPSDAPQGGMPKTTLGRMDVEVSVIGWGGAGTSGGADQIEAIWDAANAMGMNFIDTAPSYGASEDLLGEQLSHRRSEFIVATKSHPIGADETLREVENSLRRLKIDVIDLLYAPHGTNTHEQFRACFGKGGVMEGALEAKKRGLAKHLGYSLDYFNMPFDTGHTRALIDTDIFDVVQLPYNLVPMEPVDQDLIPFAREKNMGVVANFPTIGALTGREWGVFYPTFQGRVDTPGQATLLGVLANPGVDVVLTKFSSVARAQENCQAGVIYGTMSEAELNELREAILSHGPVRYLFRKDVPPAPPGVNLRRALIHYELYTRFGYGGARKVVEQFLVQMRSHPDWTWDESIRDTIEEIQRAIPVLLAVPPE